VEYADLNEEAYEFIVKVCLNKRFDEQYLCKKYSDFQEISKSLGNDYEVYHYFYNRKFNDETHQYDYDEKQTLEKNGLYNTKSWKTLHIFPYCKDGLPYKIGSMFFQFPILEKLLQALGTSKSRYYPKLMITVDHHTLEKHAFVLLFDTKEKKVYLIDTNKGMCGNDQIIDMFTELFSKTPYSFISSYEILKKELNVINKEENYPTFSKGYCMAYSILISELFLLYTQEEPTTILEKLTDLSDYDRNEIVIRYTNWLYMNKELK
jgi:hypothetical protein